MLVLTRKCGETIVVGDADCPDAPCKVTVLGIEHGKVRLGFEAPAGVAIHRFEVWQRIRAQTQIDKSTGSADA
jgi:carbon storage regulator